VSGAAAAGGPAAGPGSPGPGLPGPGLPGAVLVTGASGFVGGVLARHLQQAGYRVRAAYRRARPPAHLQALAASGAEAVRGDLESAEDRRRLLAGCGSVIHCAALASDWGPYALFRRLNVDVTVGLLADAEAAGCRSFVFISSGAVAGFGRHVFSDETGPYYPLFSNYARSKRAAEEAVLARNSGAFKTTAIRPTNVYGPGDTTTYYRIFDALERGLMSRVAGGRALNALIYVEDLAAAVRAALERPESAGQVFTVSGGELVTWGELLDYMAGLLGVPAPRHDVPLLPAYAAAWAVSGFYKLLLPRKTPPLTRYRIAHVANDYHFSIEKARRLLGFRPRVLWPEGLRRTAVAYRRDKAAGRRP
jgi:nucleoside-diphosphate-sugar epimerase